MRRLLAVTLLIYIVSFTGDAEAQDETSGVKIKINRFVFNRKNAYSLYIPTFEFHAFFQQEFNVLRSAISADYDYRRQDMGFGMSHAFYKYEVIPGISVEDNLYFREVFTDSTGIWNRSQSMTPFLLHELNENATVGLELQFQHEWSPKRTMGSQIKNSHDRSLRVFYSNKSIGGDQWNNYLYFISFERAYKLFDGDFNYLNLELLFKHSKEINKYVRYKGSIIFSGNITVQTSPLYFIGGRETLIGFENDEFWGRRVFSSQNLIEIKPFPDLVVSVMKAKFRRIALLMQFDFGQVRGAPDFLDLKPQDMDFKKGIGFGIGINTDLPYMPATDIHILAARPLDKTGVKFYAGFGGWLN
ncbi:hypothetical protein ACFL47_02970 [Candidatus Latescibacterota bacterium]